MGHWEFIQRCRTQGVKISPIFLIPFLTAELFRIDWLHCADQGVTADYLGNLFKLVRTKLPGNNVKERTRALWVRIRAWYNGPLRITDQLPKVTPGMIQADKKTPKLRASAACARALVPFAQLIADELLSDADPMEQADKVAAYHLNRCYQSLSSDCVFHAEILKDHSIKFALQYKGLEKPCDVGQMPFWRTGIVHRLNLIIVDC